MSTRGRLQTQRGIREDRDRMREVGNRWRDQDQGSRNRSRGGGNRRGRPVGKGRVRGQFGIKHKIWIKQLPMKDQEYLNAALSGDIATLRRVISAKQVDLNVTDGFGHTALINAAWKDRVDVVELLLEKRVKLDCKNYDGQTAMDKAAYWGFTEILKLLVNAGSKINITNNNGETPLHRAAMWGHVNAVTLLLKANANPDMYKNQRRWTPLHFAAKHGKPKVVLALLEGKCDPLIQDTNGRTPMQLAKKNKQDKIILLYDRWTAYQDERELEETDPVIAPLEEAGGWDAPAPERHGLVIEKKVCSFNEEPKELLWSLVCNDEGPRRPRLTMGLAVTTDEILQDKNFLSVDTQLSPLTITPPAPKFTLERQEGLNAGLRGQSHRASQVLAFQRLPGLQVPPGKQKKASQPSGKKGTKDKSSILVRGYF